MMRFIKLMMILLGSFFMMAVLRTIMQAIQKGVTDATSDTATAKSPAPSAASPEISPGGELKKCAACGVYNAAANSVTKLRGSVTTYYCSTECRAKSAA